MVARLRAKETHEQAANATEHRSALLEQARAQVEWRAVSKLKPNPRNTRKHSGKQVHEIAASIRRFGFINPIITDEHGTILSGHGRLAAAVFLGLDVVPCLCVKHLPAVDRKAYSIADNKLALKAEWDEQNLAEEFLSILEGDETFDMSLTGFSSSEVDMLIEGLAPEDPGAPEDDRLPDDVRARTQPGDLWQLGPHKLACGDALDAATMRRLMGSETAQMVFTDPPYNVPIQGHVGGSGKTKHREFSMASGEMTDAEFVMFLRSSCTALKANSADGSIHFICMDWRHVKELMTAADGVYAELKNLIVWIKGNGGMGTFYRSRHELIFAFKNGTAAHINNFELGQHGRNRTNVWSYRGMNSFSRERMTDLTSHPTVKPVQMIADAIKDVSKRGGIVLDIFGGSGSTLIAAHKTGRRARVCEIDPTYCDRIIARWEAFSHDEAKLISRDGS